MLACCIFDSAFVDNCGKLCYYFIKEVKSMSKICCFTGHRDLQHKYELVISKTKKIITDLVEKEGVTDFRAGGAMGFDTAAALAVIALKDKHPEVKLHLIIPYPGHDKYFEEFHKKLFEYTLANADSVTYIQKHYSSSVMRIRNAALVDGADMCVSYLLRLSGGTYQTVNMARKAKIRLINVAKV